MENNASDKEYRREELRAQYRKIKKEGTNLYVSATPEEIASLCVREEYSYMPDYIYDENGTLVQIMFDRIDQ